MKSYFRKILRQEDGVTAIEFAFVAPVFFLLIFGIIEFGLIMHISSVVENAINEGARKAKTGSKYGASNLTTRKDVIEKYIKTRLGPWNIEGNTFKLTTKRFAKITTLNVTDPDDTDFGNFSFGKGGEAIMYQAAYDWKVMTPMLGRLISSDGLYRIRSTIIVKNEDFCARPPCFSSNANNPDLNSD